MKRTNTRALCECAIMLALAVILSFIPFGRLPFGGTITPASMLPICLVSITYGWKWGLGVGFVAPIFRSLTLGMPPLYPTALCMAFELATYGLICGIMHKLLPKNKGFIYVSLLTSMVAGRIIWGIAMTTCMGITGGAFTFSAFIAGAITNAIPGIIVQIVLVPILVMLAEKLSTQKAEI